MNKQYISEAFDTLHEMQSKKKTSKKVIKEARRPAKKRLLKQDNSIVPEPFDKYFELYIPSSEEDFQPGDEIKGYGCKFIGYLEPKPNYKYRLNMYPILTDDPDYPVVEMAGGRLYPIFLEDIENKLGTVYFKESKPQVRTNRGKLNESKQNRHSL